MQFHKTDPALALKAIWDGMLADGHDLIAVKASLFSEASQERWSRTDVLVSDCGTYRVHRRQEPVTAFKAPMVVLGIERVDQKPFHNWAVLQRIKNALVGPECEGMQIFPAESRLVDRANVYWLYCFANPAVRIPCGMQERHVAQPQRENPDGGV